MKFTIEPLNFPVQTLGKKKHVPKGLQFGEKPHPSAHPADGLKDGFKKSDDKNPTHAIKKILPYATAAGVAFPIVLSASPAAAQPDSSSPSSISPAQKPVVDQASNTATLFPGKGLYPDNIAQVIVDTSAGKISLEQARAIIEQYNPGLIAKANSGRLMADYSLKLPADLYLQLIGQAPASAPQGNITIHPGRGVYPDHIAKKILVVQGQAVTDQNIASTRQLIEQYNPGIIAKANTGQLPENYGITLPAELANKVLNCSDAAHCTVTPAPPNSSAPAVQLSEIRPGSGVYPAHYADKIVKLKNVSYPQAIALIEQHNPGLIAQANSGRLPADYVIKLPTDLANALVQMPASQTSTVTIQPGAGVVPDNIVTKIQRATGVSREEIWQTIVDLNGSQIIDRANNGTLPADYQMKLPKEWAEAISKASNNTTAQPENTPHSKPEEPPSLTHPVATVTEVAAQSPAAVAEVKEDLARQIVAVDTAIVGQQQQVTNTEQQLATVKEVVAPQITTKEVELFTTQAQAQILTDALEARQEMIQEDPELQQDPVFMQELNTLKVESDTVAQYVSGLQSEISELNTQISQAQQQADATKAELLRLEALKDEVVKAQALANYLSQFAPPLAITSEELVDAKYGVNIKDWMRRFHELGVIGSGEVFPTEADAQAFIDEVDRQVDEYNQITGTQYFTRDVFLTLMGFESANTYSPSITNSSDCVGLIQFCNPQSSIGVSKDALRAMTSLEQLKGPVRDYFLGFIDSFGIPSGPEDFYSYVLMPGRMVGKPLDYAVFSRQYDRDNGVNYYRANQPLDRNDDGVTTKLEVVETLNSRYKSVPNLPVVSNPAEVKAQNFEQAFTDALYHSVSGVSVVDALPILQASLNSAVGHTNFVFQATQGNQLQLIDSANGNAVIATFELNADGLKLIDKNDQHPFVSVPDGEQTIPVPGIPPTTTPPVSSVPPGTTPPAQPAPPNNGKIKVVVEGDSQSDPANSKAWPIVLDENLADDFVVVTKAHAGDTIHSQMLPELESVLNEYDPNAKSNIAVVYAGINDIYSGHQGEAVYTDLLNVVKQLQNKGFQVVVATLPQAYGHSDQSNSVDRDAQVRLYNKLIRDNKDLAGYTIADLGALPQFDENNDAVADNNEVYNGDGLHFKPAGQYLIFETIQSAMKPLIEKANTPPPVSTVTPPVTTPPAETAPPVTTAPETPVAPPTTVAPAEPAPAPTFEQSFTQRLEQMRQAASLGNGYSLPVFQEGSFVGSYGYWHSDRDGRLHQGIDIYGPAAAPHTDTQEEGSKPVKPLPVFAPVGGEIADIRTQSDGSNVIKLKGDDGRYYNFIHLADFSDHGYNADEIPESYHRYLNFDGQTGLKVGDRIDAGGLLGFVGKTGTAWYHLHFEVKTAESGNQINPIDVSAGSPETLVKGLLSNLVFRAPVEKDLHLVQGGLMPEQAASQLGVTLKVDVQPVGSLVPEPAPPQTTLPPPPSTAPTAPAPTTTVAPPPAVVVPTVTSVNLPAGFKLQIPEITVTVVDGKQQIVYQGVEEVTLDSPQDSLALVSAIAAEQGLIEDPADPNDAFNQYLSKTLNELNGPAISNYLADKAAADKAAADKAAADKAAADKAAADKAAADKAAAPAWTRNPALVKANSLIGLDENQDREQLKAILGGVDPSYVPWCAFFVTVMLEENGSEPAWKEPLKKENTGEQWDLYGYVPSIRQWAIENGVYQPLGNGYQPKVGDVVIEDNAEHIELVKDLIIEDGQVVGVITIGGNTQDQVRESQRRFDQGYIDGFVQVA